MPQDFDLQLGCCISDAFSFFFFNYLLKTKDPSFIKKNNVASWKTGNITTNYQQCIQISNLVDIRIPKKFVSASSKDEDTDKFLRNPNINEINRYQVTRIVFDSCLLSNIKY